jgi:hypothetical protein
MKRVVSKIMGIMSFTLMYMFIFPINVLAAEDKKEVLDIQGLKDIFLNFYENIKGSLTIIGIAALVPAIICLFLAYKSDKKSDGGRGILGLIWAGILLLIPGISLVMLFIWAFGSKTKSDPTFRNFARLVLLFVLYLIIFIGTYILASMYLL